MHTWPLCQLVQSKGRECLLGQSDVREFLEKNKEQWFSVKEIASSLDVSTSSVQNNVQKLRQWDWVEYKRIREVRTKTLWLYKFKA